MASTSSLDQEAAKAAADEYHQTRAFAEFVTSTLRYNTALKVDNDRIDFRGEVENDDALRVKIVWQNNTGEPIVMDLPDPRHARQAAHQASTRLEIGTSRPRPKTERDCQHRQLWPSR